ncbi:hypothetical protein F5X71_00250 [Nocardia brasiliensis]|uniref:Uncharacterized protein n=1 Tax=Nocardia brasiliensis TaxID=37326 RepID=A0A6G9XJ75_NOCBR|nr:hypothetical protein [Nocardia brasiliensis]QIS00966.1 hypothetical protein F5X71_00250 [Nocardia brasiliensis]
MTGSAAAPAEGHYGRDVPLELGMAALRHYEALREMGIVFADPFGEIEIDHARARVEIGSLLVRDDGVLEVVPCRGLTVMQRIELAYQAQRARYLGPQECDGWQYVDEIGWLVAVFEPL